MFDTVPPLVKAPAAAGKADELRDPANGLILDLGRRGRPHGQIRVEARREQVAEHADLEPGRGDEREVARTGLGDRLVERPAGVLEHLEDGRRRLGQRRPRAASLSASSIGGSVGRAWSKLRQPAATISAARSSACSRGTSRRRLTREG